jgi:hypothetical protein
MTTDDEKISSIYQQGKEQDPPAHLDSAILKAAHKAVQEAAQKSVKQAPSVDSSPTAKSPFSGGWPVTAAIAAVLVLSVILVPLVEQDESLPPAFDMADDEPGLMKQQDAVDTLGRGKQVPTEEVIAPMSAISTAPSLRKSKPASMAVGATDQHEQEYKSAPGIQLQSSPMLATDIASDVIDKNRPNVIPAPEKWLKKIRQLIDKGEFDEARKELDEFKKSYPDVAIDKSMLRQLEEKP